MAKELTEEIAPLYSGAAEPMGGVGRKGVAGLLDMLRAALESKPVKDVTEGIPPNVMPAGAMAKGGAAGAGWLGKLLAASPGLAMGTLYAAGVPTAQVAETTLRALPRTLRESLMSNKAIRSILTAPANKEWAGQYRPTLKEIALTPAPNAPRILGHEFDHDLIGRLYPTLYDTEGMYRRGIPTRTNDPVLARLRKFAELPGYARMNKSAGTSAEAAPFEAHANVIGDLVNFSRGVPMPASIMYDLHKPDTIADIHYINKAIEERLRASAPGRKVIEATATQMEPVKYYSDLRDWVQRIVEESPEQYPLRIPLGQRYEQFTTPLHKLFND